MIDIDAPEIGLGGTIIKQHALFVRMQLAPERQQMPFKIDDTFDHVAEPSLAQRNDFGPSDGAIDYHDVIDGFHTRVVSHTPKKRRSTRGGASIGSDSHNH